MFGKYFDLTTLHQSYQNLNQTHMTLRTYIEKLDQFDLTSHLRPSEKYTTYLQTLKDYIEKFIMKAIPLFDFIGLKKKLIVQFNRDWLEGKYENKSKGNTVNNNNINSH